MDLSDKQKARYARTIALPEVGLEGQAKLCEGSVLIVGAGGLGSPAALYLAATGVGTVGIVDSDRVSLDNLQRQVLHRTKDIGRPKTDSARDTLNALNPDITVKTYDERFTSANATALLAEYDFVIDATDNFVSQFLIADACHALCGMNQGQSVGTLANLNTFSFHAVKPLATGEGGMITTNNPHYPKVMREFRNHCITSDHRERQEAGSWFYEVDQLGYNYRLTDFQCALGMSQLKKVPAWTSRRQEIAQIYNKAFASLAEVTPLKVREDVSHAYHLYVIKLELDSLRVNRDEIFKALRAENIGVNVHYIPVHLHPFYVNNYGTKEGQCPNAEDAYEQIISLPMFAGMRSDDVKDVVTAVEKVIIHYSK